MPSRKRPSGCKPSLRPWLEAFEERLAPSVFNIAPSAADGAAGSLRVAIDAANTNDDPINTINLVSNGA